MENTLLRKPLKGYNHNINPHKTLKSFMKWIEDNENLETNMYRSHYESDSRTEFTESTSFADALERLKKGDAEIMKGLKEATALETAKLRKELNSMTKGYEMDNTGLFFDMGMVLSGEPDCWFRKPTEETVKPRITVPILGSYSANTETSDVIRTASKTIALVKALEDADFEVEVIFVFAGTGQDKSKNHTDISGYTIIGKGFNETFNWKKLSAMLHPSFFRRIGFRAREIMFPTSLDSGYGYALSLYDINNESAIELADESTVARFKEQVLYTLKG